MAPSSSISIMAPTQFPLPGFAQASQLTSRLPPTYLLSAVSTMEGFSAISLFGQLCSYPSQVSPLLSLPNIP